MMMINTHLTHIIKAVCNEGFTSRETCILRPTSSKDRPILCCNMLSGATFPQATQELCCVLATTCKAGAVCAVH